MLAYGNGLDCGLFMSGSAAARGPRPPCGGIRSPACPAARGYPTHAGGTHAFEEAEGTRLLLRSALADMLRVNFGGNKENRPSQSEACC